MAKLAVLKIVDGDFERGFRITLRISEEGDSTATEIDGRLPPAPMLPARYDRWQLAYRTRPLVSTRRLEAKKGQETNYSILDSATDLQQSINEWLNSGDRQFQPIRDGLLENLSRSDEIRFTIRSEEGVLWRLPWHLWNFFERYSKAEVGLSTLEYEQVKALPAKNPKSQVRILVILGDSTDINVQKDLEVLKQQLPDSYIWPLMNPQRNQLSDELWERDWDILFFAGHSSSEGDGKGRIYINQTENLTIEELKYGLKRAIAHGLKLAIFNSCDGMGLARDLANLQISATIVMRERVPDWVAQKFLEYFLKAFAENEKSLYASVREARERLQSLEREYPCATWLPVICQNSAEVQLTWQELRDQTKRDRRQLFSPWHSLQTLLLTSVVVTSIMLGVRSLGMLQTWELQAFDQSLRLRPPERPDDRLLVVKVTEGDIQKLRQYPLTDQTVVKLLKKLEHYQPRAIGLDIYRDIPQQPGRADLVERLQQSDRLIAACEVGGTDENPGIGPPDGIPDNSLGFTDFLRDDDGIFRRHLLAMAPGSSPCHTDKSFSLRVALRYLQKQGIQLKLTPEQYFQLGTVVFKPLEKDTVGYHQLDDLGHQVLLNYRSSPQIAQQVTLTNILNGSLDRDLPKLVKERIVLIGTTAKSVKDYFPTPYSAGQSPIQEIPGVIVHAHMVSQILSAVLDHRPLLWVWPKWSESLWIWCWSLVGGMIALYLRSQLRLVLALGTTLGILYVICFGILTQGGWVPLVPSALVLITTSGSVVVYTVSQHRRQVDS